MTTTPAIRQCAKILQAGRDAAAERRRADSQRCRDRVTAVIDDMRRRRTPLSDAEITRRAGVNAQYLQRHRDLKLHAEQVRAAIVGDTARQADIAKSAAELALRAENGMLIEQNHQLRTDLDAAHAELRQLRAATLPSPPPVSSPADYLPMTESSTCNGNSMRSVRLCTRPSPTSPPHATSINGCSSRTPSSSAHEIEVGRSRAGSAGLKLTV